MENLTTIIGIAIGFPFVCLFLLRGRARKVVQFILSLELVALAVGLVLMFLSK